jgi:hypothetical protein
VSGLVGAFSSVGITDLDCKLDVVSSTNSILAIVAPSPFLKNDLILDCVLELGILIILV